MARNRKERRKDSTARRMAEKQAAGGDRTAIKAPPGVGFFTLKKSGIYTLDIVPYTAGAGNPNADEGELHFERSYEVHKGVGPSQQTFICASKTFNKPCPICEYRFQLEKSNGDRDIIKSLYPKKRQLFNVWDRKNEEAGVQIWDISTHLFGNLLGTRILNDDEDEYQWFYMPDEQGMTLKITAEEKSFNGQTFCEVVAIDFKKRSKPLPKEVLSAAVCLDECLLETPYKELNKIFLQENMEDDEEEEEEKPTKKKSKKPFVDDDDDDNWEDDEEKPAKKKSSKKVKDEEDEDDWEDEEEEKPTKKKSSKKSSKKVKDEEDEDNWDDDEKEEEDEEEDDWDDDEEDDNEEDEEDEEDEEEEKPVKKKASKKATKKSAKKAKDDDDWDEE